jgi:hypothetical protein
MELSEDLKYRLAYLTLRLIFDERLANDDAGAHPGMLALLDVLAGTQLSGDAGGKRYASQRPKLESFIDAEFGDEIMELVTRTVAEMT